MKEKIVICMPMKNAFKTIEKSIQSVLFQKNTKRDILLLIGNDNSSDNSLQLINEFLPNPNIILLNVHFGKVYQNRNHLNDFARKNIPNCVLIGRLDADDVLLDEYTISKIEARFDEYNFDVLLCGNQQSKNGLVLEWKNSPNVNLLDDNYLLQQLFEMTKGNPQAELPSCNTFIKPNVKIEYPNKESAEDHWFTVLLLLQKDSLKIHIDEELLYCTYSLDGYTSKTNQSTKKYFEVRRELFYFLSKEIKNKLLKKPIANEKTSSNQ